MTYRQIKRYGDAEFFQIDALTLAMNPDVEAAASDVQPIILFTE